MATSSWCVFVCPSSDLRTTSLSASGLWFWLCFTPSYQVLSINPKILIALKSAMWSHTLLNHCVQVIKDSVSVFGVSADIRWDKIWARWEPFPECSRCSWCLISPCLPVSGIMLLLLAFFAFLHCWLNLFGELLCFADRMFYKVCVPDVLWHNKTCFFSYSNGKNKLTCSREVWWSRNSSTFLSSYSFD